jgi:hypothetical protein
MFWTVQCCRDSGKVFLLLYRNFRILEDEAACPLSPLDVVCVVSPVRAVVTDVSIK